MDRIRTLLRLAGKGNRKVSAVFGIAPEHCDRAVKHLRAGAPEVPVWLFATASPLPETVELCERVVVASSAVGLFLAAQKQLWPHWVALSVATWTGERGRWPVKGAALLVPPFRALLMNRHGDFFPAAPGPIGRHAWRGVRDAFHAGWNRAKDLLCGLGLWLFALPAQHFSALSRWAFIGRHGAGTLDIEGLPDGSGTAVFRYSHRKWNRDELLELVYNSTCRQILFLENGAQGDVHWVDDPATFAVSRQPGFRAWKPCLMPAAPFRPLEPREISRTLAPVSNCMLVDRAKLAALGIPETIVPGSTWLMLFWKAAAAGWCSYSVAGETDLKEIPDWPYEEAEFVTKALSDHTLRALGPREPDLARGSIATRLPAPGSRPGKLRVLVVSPYLPYPLSHGGAVRIYNLCRALSDRVDFILACFREKDDTTDYDRLYEVFREVWVVDRDEHAVEDPELPGQVREHVSRSMRALIGRLAGRVDLMQLEFTHMAAFRDAAPGLPAILVEHDLTFTLYRQLAARYRTRTAHLEYERWLAFETFWLPLHDAVWTMSPEDCEAALALGSPPGRTVMVPNGVDLERFVPAEEPAEDQEILYVGSFRHLPNLLGFEKLRSEVMPRVWERCPRARLCVVAGPEPGRYWREFLDCGSPGRLDPRIEMHEFVPDLLPFYARAAVAVVPLEVSAGTNIKVIEAMACRRAVVSTPVGCAGLGLEDGRDIVIRECREEFADAVADLLRDPAARSRIAAQARCTVERRFGWQAIAGQAHASYLSLAARAAAL